MCVFFATISCHVASPYNEGPCVCSSLVKVPRMGVLEWLLVITRHTRWGAREALGGRGALGPEGSNGPENPSPREWGSQATGSNLQGESGPRAHHLPVSAQERNL